MKCDLCARDLPMGFGTASDVRRTSLLTGICRALAKGWSPRLAGIAAELEPYLAPASGSGVKECCVKVVSRRDKSFWRLGMPDTRNSSARSRRLRDCDRSRGDIVAKRSHHLGGLPDTERRRGAQSDPRHRGPPAPPPTRLLPANSRAGVARWFGDDVEPALLHPLVAGGFESVVDQEGN